MTTLGGRRVFYQDAWATVGGGAPGITWASENPFRARMNWLRADRRVAITAPPALWDAMRLPPGFRMSSRANQALPGSSEPVAHLVFTDGVASVSVFVEPRKRDAQAAEGPSRVGSSSAFTTVVDDHQVTVVGEVPPNTVKFIATQVKATSPRATSSPASATEGLGIAPPRRK
jgi:sigma-E factor negative regulatory protein RseB